MIESYKNAADDASGDEEIADMDDETGEEEAPEEAHNFHPNPISKSQWLNIPSTPCCQYTLIHVDSLSKKSNQSEVF